MKMISDFYGQIREEKVSLGFKKQVILLNMSGSDTFSVKSCLNN